MIDQINSTTRSNHRSFYVVLHDVAPCFSRQVAAILDALAPLINTRIAAAVVPSWHGKPITSDDDSFIRLVRERFGDVLLHGFTHARTGGRGLVSLMTGSADEFNGLSPEESESRLERGQAALREQFNGPACGFIAPTFQRGRLTADRLARHGLNYAVGFRHIDFADGSRIPIATWCWDMGRWGALGHAGHFYGNLRMRLYSNLLPCLAIHPVDVDRGFLPHIVKLTQKLLDEDRSPILFDAESGKSGAESQESE
jgi:predicted deacetylase